MNPVREFRDMAARAGAINMQKVMASAILAIRNGDSPYTVLDCLQRNRPEMFDAKRQRKAL